MDFEVASNLMYHLAGDDPGVECAADEIYSWLELLPLPIDLKRMLQWHWPKHAVQLGPIYVYSPSGIKHARWADPLIRHKLIQIGDCPNGDAFVIDFETDACNIGFLTHEQYDDRSNARHCYQPVFRSLESFLYRVAEGQYVPTDYFAGKSFVRFLCDERDHENAPPFEKRTEPVVKPEPQI